MRQPTSWRSWGAKVTFKNQAERDAYEANRRFDFDVRSRGAGAAVDAMFERNAKRRESDRREAERKDLDGFHNRIGKVLDRLDRNPKII